MDKFPKLEETKKSIQKLQKIEWPKLDEFENIESYIKHVEGNILVEFNLFPNLLRMVKPKDFTLPLFRVRPYKDIKNRSLFAEYNYPPIAFTTFGRCNFPEHPVFYCSNNPVTAIAEVNRNTNFKNQEFCISKWKLIESEEEIAFQTFLSTGLDKKNVFSELQEMQLSRINEPFEGKLSDETKSSLIEFLNFLDDTFIKDTDWNLSAAIAHRSLYANHNFATDILMYPSNQTKGKGVNLAINPNFVDNKMQLERVYFVKIKKMDAEMESTDISFGKYAYLDKNVLIWRYPNSDDQQFLEYFKNDFKSFDTSKHRFEKES